MKVVIKNYTGRMSNLNYIIDREKIKNLTGIKRDTEDLVENQDVEAYLDWFTILEDIKNCNSAKELLSISYTPVFGVYSRQVCHELSIAVDNKIDELSTKEEK